MHNLHTDLSFFPERIKIEKAEMLVANLNDTNEYATHVRIFKNIYQIID